jgi:hypothetical protein
MNRYRVLRCVLNLLLALTLAAGPALAMPSAPGHPAAVAQVADAGDAPCHGAPPPADVADAPCHHAAPPQADAGCTGDCCADAGCDPGACRMGPALMVSAALPLAAVTPEPMSFPVQALPPPAVPAGEALRPPIA